MESKENRRDSWVLGIYCDCMPQLMELDKYLPSSEHRKKFIDELRETAEKYIHAIKLKQFKSSGLGKNYHHLVEVLENEEEEAKKGGSGLYTR